MIRKWDLKLIQEWDPKDSELERGDASSKIRCQTAARSNLKIEINLRIKKFP